MKIERALAVRAALKVRIADLYAAAKFGGYSADEIAENTRSIRADAPKGTPGWVFAYLDGYCEAQRDDLYRNHLIFGGFVDGVFYSTHSNRPDYYASNGIDPVDYADDGKVTGRGHYWDRVTPYRGGFHDKGSFKPFFVNQ